MVRLAASVKEIDDSSIAFPPIQLRMKREESGRVLQASLVSLTRDSDRDGLTDLVEDRLLLDPDSADTDGDGISDGNDPAPQIGLSSDAGNSRADAIAGLLFQLTGSKLPAAVITAPRPAGQSSKQPVMPNRLASERLDQVLFVLGNRADFGGVRSLQRVLVYSDEELKRMQSKFGPTYAMKIQVDFDRSGNRALLEWDERWRGGRFLATRENGKWTLKSLGSWVT